MRLGLWTVSEPGARLLGVLNHAFEKGLEHAYELAIVNRCIDVLLGRLATVFNELMQCNQQVIGQQELSFAMDVEVIEVEGAQDC